jgi:DNA-binding NtrC family response regulator
VSVPCSGGVPSLRQRAQDIPELVRHFVRKHAPPGEQPAEVAPEVLEAMAKHTWPGNVRELENMVQRALIMAAGQVLGPADFLFASPAPTSSPVGVREQARSEKAAGLRRLLLAHGGNCASAAREMGIPRTTLVSRAKKLRLF